MSPLWNGRNLDGSFLVGTQLPFFSNALAELEDRVTLHKLHDHIGVVDRLAGLVFHLNGESGHRGGGKKRHYEGGYQQKAVHVFMIVPSTQCPAAGTGLACRQPV